MDISHADSHPVTDNIFQPQNHYPTTNITNPHSFVLEQCMDSSVAPQTFSKAQVQGAMAASGHLKIRDGLKLCTHLLFAQPPCKQLCFMYMMRLARDF